MRLAIFHTNDMHGHLDAMCRLSTFSRRMRSQAEGEGCHVFFWDAGDAADRRVPLVSATKGSAFPPILNAMGYTLQTMGNDLALTYGPQVMAAFAARATFPILAANFQDKHGCLIEGLRECVIVPLTPTLKLGIIGLTAPWNNVYEAFGVHLPDFCSVAESLVKSLRLEGASPVLVLSHLGLSDDRILAEAVPDIDAIIGAHSHDRLPTGEEVNGVLIAQAGQYAEALGRIDLVLDDKTGKVLQRSAILLEVPQDEPPDPVIFEAIQAAEREVAVLMQRPIGTLQAPLNLNYFRECDLGNYVADVLRERMKAEIGIVASGQFHEGLPQGMITFGTLNASSFGSANPGVTDLSGAEILRAIERGLDPALAESKPGGLRGSPLGLPQISGLTVQFDPNAVIGNRVKQILVHGERLDTGRLYRVAHTDVEVSDGDQFQTYVMLDNGKKAFYELPTILREAIEDHFRDHSPITVPTPGRWLPPT
jgi:2',3'-cyclic-nucleotide 2'-phosphodiesterase (5'-nucleotidase family)